MPTNLEGDLIVRGMRAGIVLSRFNAFITEKLLEGATDTLVRHGAEADAITVVRVPGAFEIPWTARRMVRSGAFDAVICLGCVIRGGTDHYVHVAGEASKGVAAVALESDIPVVFGVLTVESLEQAIERAGTKMGNKGAEAAMAAIEMVNLRRAMDAAWKA